MHAVLAVTELVGKVSDKKTMRAKSKFLDLDQLQSVKECYQPIRNFMKYLVIL